jgi:hypothetical protein
MGLAGDTIFFHPYQGELILWQATGSKVIYKEGENNLEILSNNRVYIGRSYHSFVFNFFECRRSSKKIFRSFFEKEVS